MKLTELADNRELLEVARKAIEDELIWMRDNHAFILRNNGLVIREQDGRDSSVIRFGPEDAMRIGLKAIAKHIDKTNHAEDQ
jgi:hypothetical protein